MDMQNASNLVIPEGEVRTIHDKDSRLIWGRVNYDTKYAGDTYQQTYSGANLYNVNDPAGVSTGASVDEDGWITLTANNTGSSATYVNYYGEPMQLAADTEYAIVVELKYIKSNNLSNTNNYLRLTDSNSSQFNGTYALPFTSTNPTQVGTHVGILRTKPDISGASRGLRTFLTVAPDVDQEVTFRISVLADTSVTPQTFVYQPFTGNIPAPNPDYPQDIDVVTGAQTVTIGDGMDSEAFPISLGSLELCKIGNYQDYIYKSGDDWYVHKACGKAVLDGSDDETWNTSSLCYYVTLADKIKSPYGVCDHFIYSPDAFSTSDTAYRGRCTGNKNDTGLYFMPLDASQSSVALFKTWLSTNQTTAYYPLATATDTKITDATLIGQLNAVHEWLTRYGYNATVTGNLPIIIDRANL